MKATDMIHEQEDFHIRRLKQSVERLEERKQSGEECVDIPIGELQRLMLELLAAHHSCNAYAKMFAQLSNSYLRQIIVETPHKP